MKKILAKSPGANLLLKFATMPQITEVRMVALLISVLWFTSGSASAASIDTFPTEYIAVGVSGYKTIKDKASAADVLSSQLASNGQPSGVWENLLPDVEIYQRAYLTHYSKARELDAVVKLFVDPTTKTCVPTRELIIMANSWGAKNAEDLAKRFFKSCGRKPTLFVMIDGITKPTTMAYRKTPIAERCINFYQKEAMLHGEAIAGCENHELSWGYTSDLYQAHIQAEWSASELASDIIRQDYLH